MKHPRLHLEVEQENACRSQTIVIAFFLLTSQPNTLCGLAWSSIPPTFTLENPHSSNAVMKRSADLDKADNGRTQKRPKSSQACSSCRKHKTRCELIDDLSVGPYRCHRCKVLNVSCSFESSDLAPPIHESSPTPQPRTVSQTHEPIRHEPPRIPARDIPRDSRASPATIKDGCHLDQQIKPEDLLPVPPHAPWGFEKVPGGFDWTATPMLAMQKLTIRTPGGEEPFVSDISAKLANIISPERIKTLLNMCVL